MTLAQRTVGDLLDSVSAREPTPGGGAVAALVAALAAALGRMVVAYGRSPRDDSAGRLTSLQQAALALAEQDMQAFGHLAAAWSRPRDDPGRVGAVAGAARGAIEAPQLVMANAVEVLHVLEHLSQKANANLRSDLAIAALLAQSAAEAAAWNVRVNLPLLGADDPGEAGRLESETVATLERIGRTRDAVERACLSM